MRLNMLNVKRLSKTSHHS